jgi:proteic killer suppression protein
MAILSVRHKGLRRLIEAGDRRGFTREVADKLEDMLTVIHTAKSAGDIEAYPGWKLHPLKGDLKGYWSLTVTRNYRLIFRFKDGDARDLDLVDYH